MGNDDQNRTMYVKIRGHAYGPLTESRVREMARKGQFSRIHQVSSDGKEWRSAAELPELFEGLTSASGRGSGESARPAPAAAEPRVWYFRQNNESIGPLALTDLKGSIASGLVTIHTPVWRDGMEQWLGAGRIDELRGLFPDPSPVSVEERPRRTGKQRARSRDQSEPESAGISPVTIHSLRAIAPWTLFIAVVGFVWAGLLLFGGIFQIATQPSVLTVGVISILMACTLFTGSLFLIQSSISLGRTVRSGSVEDLDDGMRAAGRFWIFAGFVVIVMLVMQLLLMIAMINAAVRTGDPLDWPW